MSSSSSLPLRPVVSVVLPVRDGASTIACAIESIRAQTLAEWELLLIDDGSEDATVAIAESFVDARIRLVKDGQKLGIAARLNQGIDLTRGRYLARMDADDVAYPERLAIQVAFLDGNPDIDLVATKALLFRGEGEVIGLFPFRGTHEEICDRPWNGFYLPHPTWMGRIGWFRRFRYGVPEVARAEDQDLLLRAFDSSRFASIGEVLMGYRIAPTTLVKLLAVRFALARTQFVVNLRAGRLAFALLGATTFMMKGAVDAARHFLGRSGAWRYRNQPVPAAETARWESVWRSTRAACEGID
jgi:glycosyltransferase involved in cell wall biosynthesis